MAGLQLSGIGLTLANSNPLSGAPGLTAVQNASGRTSPTAPLNRGPLAAEASDGAPDTSTDTSAALAPKVPSNAPPLGTGAPSDAIGTQMVLVFDDQTHSMTVKILDILTQKVEQPLPLPSGNTAAQSMVLGQGGSGTLVDTKA